MKKRKVKGNTERQIYTYAELRHASKVVLDKGEKGEDGFFYQCMASLIFSAFTMEAYLNHIGPKVFICWSDLDRLPPLSKLDLVTEKLGIGKDEGTRPYQTLKSLFRFRNSIAHGKSASSKYDFEDSITVPFEEYQHEPKKTEWEGYCNLENAKHAIEDIEKIIMEINSNDAVHEDSLFFLSKEVTSLKLLPES